jgi:hypothetical protein
VRNPFKIGTETAVTLDKEIPRDRRFQGDDDEQKVLAAADPHLRAVIIALLDTPPVVSGRSSRFSGAT